MNRLASMALVFAVFALGCESTTEPADETVAPSEAMERTDAPTLNTFINNPGEVGFGIFRFESGVGMGLRDPESPLRAHHTTFPECGGVLELADVQVIADNPDDPMADRVRLLLLADPINIFVVDESQPGDCFGQKLIASGTGKLVNTDNDFFAFLNGAQGANAFGFQAQGALSGPDGRAHYNGVLRIVAGKNVTRKFNFRWLDQ